MSDPTDTLIPGFEPCDGARTAPANRPDVNTGPTVPTPDAVRDLTTLADDVERIADSYDLPADAALLRDAAAELRRYLANTSTPVGADSHANNTAQIGHHREDNTMTITDTISAGAPQAARSGYVPLTPSPEVAKAIETLAGLRVDVIPQLIEFRDLYIECSNELTAAGAGEDHVYQQLGLDALLTMLGMFGKAANPHAGEFSGEFNTTTIEEIQAIQDSVVKIVLDDPSPTIDMAPSPAGTQAGDPHSAAQRVESATVAAPSWMNPEMFPSALASEIADTTAAIVELAHRGLDTIERARAILDRIDADLRDLPDGAYGEVRDLLGTRGLEEVMWGVHELTTPDPASMGSSDRRGSIEALGLPGELADWHDPHHLLATSAAKQAGEEG